MSLHNRLDLRGQRTEQLACMFLLLGIVRSRKSSDEIYVRIRVRLVLVEPVVDHLKLGCAVLILLNVLEDGSRSGHVGGARRVASSSPRAAHDVGVYIADLIRPPLSAAA